MVLILYVESMISSEKSKMWQVISCRGMSEWDTAIGVRDKRVRFFSRILAQSNSLQANRPMQPKLLGGRNEHVGVLSKGAMADNRFRCSLRLYHAYREIPSPLSSQYIVAIPGILQRGNKHPSEPPSKQCISSIPDGDICASGIRSSYGYIIP